MHNSDFYEQRFEEAIDIELSSTNKLSIFRVVGSN